MRKKKTGAMGDDLIEKRPPLILRLQEDSKPPAVGLLPEIGTAAGVAGGWKRGGSASRT